MCKTIKNNSPIYIYCQYLYHSLICYGFRVKNQEIEWLLSEKYQGVESDAFLADCVKLAAGVPLAYLIGHVPFLDCTIYLDSHPLIPRPETEYWVELVITEIKKEISLVFASVARQSTTDKKGNVDCHVIPLRSAPRKDAHDANSNLRDSIPKILDLCSGSGAIGVAVAKALPSAHVTFAELDNAHLPTIEKNILSNLSVNRKVGPEQYSVLTSNLFEGLERDLRFDYILTNPPYIDVEANTVDANVTEHEPHLALFGGVAGMELIARIINEAPLYLNPNGQLWIEHEPAQVAVITTLAQEHGFSVITHPDQYGVPRFSVLTMAQ